MMSTSTNTGYSLFQALPDELIYEINLMALDVYNEHRKRLMRSVRRKGIERIMTDSGMWGGPVVQFQRAQKLVNTDGTINELVDQVVNEDWGWNRGAGQVFEIPMGPLLKLRRYFQDQYMFNGYRM